MFKGWSVIETADVGSELFQRFVAGIAKTYDIHSVYSGHALAVPARVAAATDKSQSYTIRGHADNFQGRVNGVSSTVEIGTALRYHKMRAS